MLTRCLTLIGLIATLLIFSGCGPKETMLSRNWGNSFESAKQSQILNPEAGRNLEPVVGLDGQVAGNNMEKYRQGFKKDTSKEMTITIKNE
ncbi:MAG: pilus assembly protein [Deltaproteobacteria bacterium]|nr:pilus assembly protein [Deltaproteobacteria bacterium]